MQGSCTAVPVVARTAASPPVVSRSFSASGSCRREVRLPDFEDVSDAEGLTVDTPYFLRSMPSPLSISRVQASEGGTLPSPQFQLSWGNHFAMSLADDTRDVCGAPPPTQGEKSVREVWDQGHLPW